MSERSFTRGALIALFLFIGLLVGVLMVPVMEGKGSLYLLSAGSLIVIIALILLGRSLIRKTSDAAGESVQGSEGSNVGFVVDTFHELVEKLKAKEKELEELKSIAEERAGSMEVYSENILRSVPSGVITVDNCEQIKSINQSAERILGINAQEGTGKIFKEIFRDPLTDILDEKKTVSRAEYPYVTDDKRHIWLGVTTSRLINASDEKIGFIFVFSDLTDIKALQAQVELKHRLSQLGEMSAGISHELRNSMSVIAGYAKLLSRKIEPEHKTTVDSIQSEISNMDNIISELLAFAKPSVIHKERVELSELLKDAVHAVVPDDRGIDVSVKETGPVTVSADEVLLRQALTNLFINAADAMPDGGRLDIDILVSGGNAEVTVRDSGEGIPEDVVGKIFLPFFTTREKGTGFGLALVQKIVISHGGRIEVESVPGTGTAFILTIPLWK